MIFPFLAVPDVIRALLVCLGSAQSLTLSSDCSVVGISRTTAFKTNTMGDPAKTDSGYCLHHQSFSNQRCFFAPKELAIDPMCEGEPVKQIRTPAALLALLTGAREPLGPSDPCDFNPSALLCAAFLHPPVSPPHVHE